jgi:hypothetical protein
MFEDSFNKYWKRQKKNYEMEIKSLNEKLKQMQEKLGGLQQKQLQEDLARGGTLLTNQSLTNLTIKIWRLFWDSARIRCSPSISFLSSQC